MEKKYQVLTLEIEKSGNLNLDKLSEMEKNKVLENRDIIYVYFGKKDLYIGQTINLLQRHQQHKLEIEFKMKNYTNLVLLYGTLIDKHLDYIEKSLINLFIADNDKGKDLKNKRIIRNKTMGNHSNYTTLEKDIDAEVLTPFWEKDLKAEEYYVNGKFQARVNVYYDNGDKEIYYMRKNKDGLHEKYGKYTYFFRDGMISEGYYSNNEKTGDVTYFHLDGTYRKGYQEKGHLIMETSILYDIYGNIIKGVSDK